MDLDKLKTAHLKVFHDEFAKLSEKEIPTKGCSYCELITEVERLKAENDLLLKAIDNAQFERAKGKQDREGMELEIEKLKAEKAPTCESLGYHICGSNSVEGRLRKALEKIREGKGRFNTDQLIHASNTIEDMKAIADKALKGD